TEPTSGHSGDSNATGLGLLGVLLLHPVDVALFLEGLEVTHHAIRRRNSEGVADVPDGRREAFGLDVLTDEAVERLLFVGQRGLLAQGGASGGVGVRWEGVWPPAQRTRPPHPSICE